MGSQPVIQSSFNSGEWAPALAARVDLTKYHSGAALLRNFFVDYRGGATTRPGTKYILQCYKSATAVRLIPFQASFTVSYVLEFGDLYICFFNNGSPVLETPIAITAATQANPAVISVANTWSVGDWIFINSVAGMTQLNGNYYRVNARSAGTVTLGDLNGVNINSTAYGAYTFGGTAARVYTIASPYTASELSQIKFAQNVNALFLCHPNHPPYQLTLITATNWTLGAITFGSTVAIPTGQAVTSTLPASTYNYAYVVTAVDANGQESGPSAYAAIANLADLRNTGGTNTVTWNAVTGAASYNVYKAEVRVSAAVPVGAAFGFAGNCTGLTFIDSNISQDFSQGPPVLQNPFFGTGVQSVTITATGTYSGGNPVPAVTFTGGGGAGAAGQANLQCIAVASIVTPGAGYVVGETFYVQGNTGGLIVEVISVTATGVNALAIVTPGVVPSGTLPSAPQAMVAIPGQGVGCTFNLTWGVASVGITSPGTGYGPAPAVGFSGGGATATATLGTPSSGNPTVPQFFQQRFVLSGPVSNAQQFNLSQPGSYYNFNVHNPLEADDAIQGTLVSGRLNTIKSLVSMPTGLAVLTDQQAWLINGGSNGSGISALGPIANAQAYNGASDVPPIIANYDILYVQAKGSIVRDLSYNFYTNVYTGADISVLSSHLFYGFTILEWAWAEEPFKVVWATRNDGNLLSLTFLKDQELIAWAHSDTQGSFKSIATVTETVSSGAVDAIYHVIQRTINGNTVQYIERFTELYYPTGATDAVNVDASIQYNGASALTFSGAQHLAGATVTGLATDNLGRVTVITPFAMPTNQTGTFTLPAPTSPATGYTRVTLGLFYTPQLKTLQLDLGEPTVQGKRKKITAVTVRCENTLGLQIGSDFNNLVVMKDLVPGNVGSATNQVVTGLVTADARTIIDPKWSVPGQYCIQQPFPYPASILGVIPEIAVGDTK